MWSFFSLLFLFPSLFLIFFGFVTLKPGPALASTTWWANRASVKYGLGHNIPRCTKGTHHLHDSSSSWSREAASSTSSPATRTHCRCLQRDPQRASTNQCKWGSYLSSTPIRTRAFVRSATTGIKKTLFFLFTQNTAWTSPRICCCLWSGSWRTWSCRCNSRRYFGRSLTYGSQTSSSALVGVRRIKLKIKTHTICVILPVSMCQSTMKRVQAAGRLQGGGGSCTQTFNPQLQQTLQTCSWKASRCSSLATAAPGCSWKLLKTKLFGQVSINKDIQL